MAFDRRSYPKDWPHIRQQILARAGNRCEGSPEYPWCRAENHRPHPVTGSRVVLTIAHIWDQDKMNCDATNLRALCQRCHLNWDRAHHRAVQRQRREEKRQRRQPELELVWPAKQPARERVWPGERER